MDGSTLALMEDLDNITLADGLPTDFFSMRTLTHRSQAEIGLASVSYGLERSISNAVERNLTTSAMDLYEACRDGNMAALNTLLLDKTAPDLDQLNSSGLSTLHYAARSNQAEVIQLLIDHGADVNVVSSVDNKGLSPLHFAAWFNAAKAVDVLIHNKAFVESCSLFGQKPLHYVVARASAELVKTLLIKGKANPNGLDNQNFSPLHLATQRGRLDIIKILFEHGADLCATDDEGETAIHLAAKEGRDEVLRHLLQKASMTGVSCKDLINKENCEGKACLHLAVQGGHVEAAMVCIEYGADVRSVIERWWKELHERMEKYFKEQLNWLKDQGHYNPHSERDRMLLAFLMIPVVQKQLDVFRTVVWNSHRIRAQKDTALPDGVPDHIYSFPDMYGLEDCGWPVTEEELKEAALHSGVLQVEEDFLDATFRARCEEIIPYPDQVQPNECQEAFLYLKQKLLNQ